MFIHSRQPDIMGDKDIRFNITSTDVKCRQPDIMGDKFQFFFLNGNHFR